MNIMILININDIKLKHVLSQIHDLVMWRKWALTNFKHVFKHLTLQGTFWWTNLQKVDPPEKRGKKNGKYLNVKLLNPLRNKNFKVFWFPSSHPSIAGVAPLLDTALQQGVVDDFLHGGFWLGFCDIFVQEKPSFLAPRIGEFIPWTSPSTNSTSVGISFATHEIMTYSK